ncbi:ribonuclease H-like domain-containing protein, partial [Tanacetum coccineum]
YPLPKNATLNHVESDDDHLLVNVGTYQRLVGKLIYLTNARRDIAYAFHCFSQYMHSSIDSHLDAALRVLRYLKCSLGSGIQINKSVNLKLKAYADSDWARCPATRRSVSGYCVFLGDSLVTWKSKKQSNFSRSSTKAEYRSMASTTCEIAANPVFHEKSKHFEINVHLEKLELANEDHSLLVTGLLSLVVKTLLSSDSFSAALTSLQEKAMLVSRSQALREVSDEGIGLKPEYIKDYELDVEEIYDKAIDDFYRVEFPYLDLLAYQSKKILGLLKSLKPPPLPPSRSFWCYSFLKPFHLMIFIYSRC